jgi:hypothetical protein
MEGGAAERGMADQSLMVYSVVLSFDRGGLSYKVFNIHNARRTAAEIADDLMAAASQIRREAAKRE